MKIADDLDLSCVDDIDAVGTEVSGYVAFAQSIARRVTTPRGSLLDDANYGIDIRDYLNAEMSTGDLQKIEATCRGEIVKDERVADCTVSASFANKVLTLYITVTGTTLDVAFTLNVSDVTIELLTEAA